jgi:dihydrolipoamide dehydrogenase
MREVDVIVIGGGPAGENAAQYAVQGRDATAVIVEAELLGGECSYWACMPSKALLRPLDVAATAAHLQGLSTPALDRDALLARRDTWVSGYDDAGQVSWAEGAGLDVVRGRGRLTGERTVEVTTGTGRTEVLTAREAVVVATGSVAVVPEAFSTARPWTSRDATGIREVPDSIAVVGGGVVACEAARWLAALGARVTLLVRDRRLLSRAEEFAGELVADGLRGAGVDVRLQTSVTAVDRPDARDTGVGRVHGGPVTLTLDGTSLEAAEVLVATGRRPALDGLGLEAVGLTPDDLQGRTDGGPLPAWLSVVGDADGIAPLTHWGKFQARRVGAAIAARAAGRELRATPAGPVPQVVFTDPQVAWTGPTQAQAQAAGEEVRVLDADYASAAGVGLLRDDASGRARLVVRQRDDVLLGATFVGPEVAELLHAATVAITAGLTLDTLRAAVPSYPTASEIWLRLLEQ